MLATAQSCQVSATATRTLHQTCCSADSLKMCCSSNGCKPCGSSSKTSMKRRSIGRACAASLKWHDRVSPRSTSISMRTLSNHKLRPSKRSPFAQLSVTDLPIVVSTRQSPTTRGKPSTTLAILQLNSGRSSPHRIVTSRRLFVW